MNEVGVGSFSQLISNTGFAIEIVGVIVIVIGFALATIRLLRNFSSVAGEERYLNYRRGPGTNDDAGARVSGGGRYYSYGICCRYAGGSSQPGDYRAYTNCAGIHFAPGN